MPSERQILAQDEISNLLRTGGGAVDSAATILSGLGASALGGVGAIGDLLQPNMKSWEERKRQGVKRIEDTQERFTRTPRTREGAGITENVGDVFQHIDDSVNKMYLNPLAENVPGVGPELAGIGYGLMQTIGPKGAKVKGAKVKPPTPITQDALATQLRALDERIARQRSGLADPNAMEAQRVAGEQGLANMLRERERINAQHNSMYDRMMSDAPRYDPGSQQQLIPGVDPLTLEQAHGVAQDRYRQALQGMTFEDANRGLRFEYDPEWQGSALGSRQRQPGAWDVDYLQESLPDGGYRSLGKRPAREVATSRVFRRDIEEPDVAAFSLQSEHVDPHSSRAQVGNENYQQMLERLERFRGAEGEVMQRGEEAALTQARAMNERIRRHRAQLAAPGLDDAQRLKLEEQILDAKRRRPVEVDDERVRMLTPNFHEGRQDWYNLRGESVTPHESQTSALRQQNALVRRLRGEPQETPPRTTPHGAAMEDIEGRDPNAMSREAVNAFLAEGRSRPELFQYGLMPGPEATSLEDFARHFSRTSGEPLRVNWSYADSDEPSKIKVPKEHGRGEVMRDRYGDYKSREKEHSRGDYPMYDESGEVKMVEAHGPLPKGEEGPLLKKERAAGGEAKRDYRGDPKYEYVKSEGGEPKRNERGDIKERWEDNPDYSGSEVDTARISSPHGHIEVQYDDPASITATSAGKKGGQLLYQTALAHASRAGIDIGGGSLTDINAYRLLSNVLSNIARTGENPRDVAATSSGRASRARGQAEGPEVWRAEAEEGRERLLGRGTDPDRVKFDPEKGFTIDGKTASAEDIKLKLGELSPHAGARGSYGGVGQKSLMRNAVFEWLRHATPEQAKAVAAKWPKEWGPIFAGLGALGVGIGAMQEEPQMTE